jgi:hypothetical protein
MNVWGAKQIAPIIDFSSAAPISGDSDSDGGRFGLSLEKRKEIFGAMAGAELSRIERIRKEKTDGFRKRSSFGDQEKVTALRMAAKYRIHITVVIAILHEGIHLGWTTKRNPTPLQPTPIF